MFALKSCLTLAASCMLALPASSAFAGSCHAPPQGAIVIQIGNGGFKSHCAPAPVCAPVHQHVVVEKHVHPHNGHFDVHVVKRVERCDDDHNWRHRHHRRSSRFHGCWH